MGATDGVTSEQGAACLAITYLTPIELEEAFGREIERGAIFVPTDRELPAGCSARVSLSFGFSEERLELEGKVVASRPVPIPAEGGAPGVSVRLEQAPDRLRRRIEQASGVRLFPAATAPAGFPRSAPRFAARISVEIEARGRRFTAETVDVSSNGMLLLLPGVDLADENGLRLCIEHPGTGETLAIAGRIANQTRCDHGMMALGLQFQYELDRVEEVERFIRDLLGFHHARSLATVSGTLADTPLEALLETFSSASGAGTVRLTRGEDHGTIAYRDGEIVHATTGLVAGAKALGRMFSWADAHFEFPPESEPVEPSHPPLPLAPAILSAAVQRDELSRLDLKSLEPDTSFALDSERFAALEPTLDPLSLELAGNADLGFPLGALLDILTATDARIYHALSDLIEAGVLRVEASSD
jgi:Tfp pilus assembly protein PilZ